MIQTLAALCAFVVLAVLQTPPTPAPIPTPTAAASPTPVPSLEPSPLPAATASSSPSPSPSPTALPSATPAPLPSATPVPLPTPLPTPLALPPNAPPQILAVHLSDPVFHGGETVSGTVITSTNVAAVEIRVAGQRIRLPRMDFGVWQLSYTVPHVPFWLRKTYTAQVVALNTAGAAAERDLQIPLR